MVQVVAVLEFWKRFIVLAKADRTRMHLNSREQLEQYPHVHDHRLDHTRKDRVRKDMNLVNPIHCAISGIPLTNLLTRRTRNTVRKHARALTSSLSPRTPNGAHVASMCRLSAVAHCISVDTFSIISEVVLHRLIMRDHGSSICVNFEVVEWLLATVQH